MKNPQKRGLRKTLQEESNDRFWAIQFIFEHLDPETALNSGISPTGFFGLLPMFKRIVRVQVDFKREFSRVQIGRISGWFLSLPSKGSGPNQLRMCDGVNSMFQR